MDLVSLSFVYFFEKAIVGRGGNGGPGGPWLKDYARWIGLMVDRAVLVIELQAGRSMGQRSRRSLLLLHKIHPFFGCGLHCKLSIAWR
jgi:hypothetical protein